MKEVQALQTLNRWRSPVHAPTEALLLAAAEAAAGAGDARREALVAHG